MGAEAAAQPWAGGGRTRGSERLVLRSLGVCPQLRPGAERFGGAGEARATRLRCAERARSSERLLASVTSPWAKRRGGGGRGRFTAAGASVLRCGAPWLPRLTSRSPGFCGALAVLSGVGAATRPRLAASRHNSLRDENDEERRRHSECFQISCSFYTDRFQGNELQGSYRSSRNGPVFSRLRSLGSVAVALNPPRQ